MVSAPPVAGSRTPVSAPRSRPPGPDPGLGARGPVPALIAVPTVKPERIPSGKARARPGGAVASRLRSAGAACAAGARPARRGRGLRGGFGPPGGAVQRIRPRGLSGEPGRHSEPGLTGESSGAGSWRRPAARQPGNPAAGWRRSALQRSRRGEANGRFRPGRSGPPGPARPCLAGAAPACAAGTGPAGPAYENGVGRPGSRGAPHRSEDCGTLRRRRATAAYGGVRRKYAPPGGPGGAALSGPVRPCGAASALRSGPSSSAVAGTYGVAVRPRRLCRQPLRSAAHPAWAPCASW